MCYVCMYLAVSLNSKEFLHFRENFGGAAGVGDMLYTERFNDRNLNLFSIVYFLFYISFLHPGAQLG